MPIPSTHRDFLKTLGKLGLDSDGHEILVGLSVQETDEWLYLALDRDLRRSIRFRELNEKHDAARRDREQQSRAAEPKGTGPYTFSRYRAFQPRPVSIATITAGLLQSETIPAHFLSRWPTTPTSAIQSYRLPSKSTLRLEREASLMVNGVAEAKMTGVSG